MHSSFEDSASARTLYVGNLDPSVSEELLMVLFKQIGPCRSCKIIHEATSDPYAFIEFAEHQAAAHALLAMNKRLVMGKEIKVNWATTSATTSVKVDTTKHHHIFVGDIAPEIDQNSLHEAFAPFGEISEIKIAKFPDTQKSKGYCFIAFVNQQDAETAIASMNGQWLGTRKIRTNWATRKVPSNEAASNTRYRDSNNFQSGHESATPKLDYNEVWNRTGETNSTVYFGNCGDVNEDLVRSVFTSYGHIQEIRIFKEKGYAFVRFSSKESACQAICHIHGSEIHGYTTKCGWGRDESTNDRNNTPYHGNNNMSNQNQYDSNPQNSYGPPSNNNYMGNDRSGNNNYGGSYQQPNYPPQQYSNSQPWNNNNNNNINGLQSNSMRDPYPQSTNGGNDWNSNNNNNNNYYGQNFSQYNNSQQSQMYSSNSGWGSSRR
ncbi:unnamed protein product [Rotaria socialis]|uniref:RRM domain-containing protein n=1 Tax=Rotaria socialis TaxID=392032 RepID=A0A818RTM6_9BILA|nr:unnamed protein product [Rotaria socialis]CAF4652091.1 unnamed protein product [Rotaria socialis]